MTRKEGLDPHWKIRLVIRGGVLLHFASSTEPRYEPKEPTWPPLKWTPIEHPDYGDTLGTIGLGRGCRDHLEARLMGIRDQYDRCANRNCRKPVMAATGRLKRR